MINIMDIIKNISRTIEKIPNAILGSLCLVGIYKSIAFLKGLAQIYYESWQSCIDFKKRYGSDSWVLVTGGANGIGKSWVESFARRGFNIIILDIDEKAHEVKEIIEKEYKVKAHVIICDLTDQEAISQLIYQVKGFDISILVCNAGVHHHGDVSKQPIESIMKLINVNIVSTTLMIKTLLPNLLYRSQKSAIIVMSSRSGFASFPYSSIYAATKAYLRILCMSFYQEIKEKIDILCVQPLIVSTPMTRHIKVGGIICSSEDCVESAITSLGRRLETCGTRAHKLVDWYISGKNLDEKAEFSANMIRSQFKLKKP
ncbi:unnamed protein product [Blepharisma stoltei]|uniref:Uncharacterized protein n=1 Tax=Blepharisma stoltei TaxID=1481888 RepID=A0AAU9IVW0_9CILI|nr:unnamed protein product [Blepharisma stoltei]